MVLKWTKDHVLTESSVLLPRRVYDSCSWKKRSTHLPTTLRYGLNVFNGVMEVHNADMISFHAGFLCLWFWRTYLDLLNISQWRRWQNVLALLGGELRGRPRWDSIHTRCLFCFVFCFSSTASTFYMYIFLFIHLFVICPSGALTKFILKTKKYISEMHFLKTC